MRQGGRLPAISHPVDRLVRGSLHRPWLVLGAWAVLTIVLNTLVPQLESVVQHSSAPFFPANAPSVRALEAMDRGFGSGDTRSDAFVVLVDSQGLSAQDTATYRELVDRIAAQPGRVPELQDWVDQPKLRQVLVSKDRKATYLPLGLSSDIGSATSIADVKWLRGIAATVGHGPDTRIYVTGDPATITDLNDTVDNTSKRITVISLLALIAILIAIYRRPVTILIPLATIGIAVACTRGVLALSGQAGFPVSTFTPAFIAAIVLGAGTDYTVFLIARYQEELRNGLAPKDAIAVAGVRIGRVLAASGATVIIGSALLGLANLAILAATGPAIAIAIAVTAAVSLTFTPVLMAFAGLRIAAKREPRPDGFWVRTGRMASGRPAVVLVAGLVLLGGLAAFFPTMSLSFDERAAQPPSTPSNQGYAALNAHFPANETLPDYLLVSTDHTMRDPADLAALNSLSESLAKIPATQAVYSLTQPTGRPLKPATVASQVGILAHRLNAASSRLRAKRQQLGTLSSGSARLTSGASQLSSGSHAAAAAIDRFITGLDKEHAGLGRAASALGTAAHGAGELSTGANTLSRRLHQAHDQVAQAVSGLGQISAALDADPLCTVDPICRNARKALRTIYLAEHDKLIPGLAQAASGATRIGHGDGTLASGLHQLQAGLTRAQHGTAQLTAGERLFQTKLSELSNGAGQLAHGISELPPNVQKLLDATGKLTSGLNKAGGYLHQVSTHADTPEAGGFYLTASDLQRPAFSLAQRLFLSPDGKLARIQIVGTTDPLTDSGQARYHQIEQTAALAIRNTPLQHADLQLTGAGGFGNDLDNYLHQDAKLVALAVLISVFFILVIALRALVAPLYLLASVVLSYAAAMGLMTLVWQHLLGHQIDFFVPVLAFVLLVAVGADYNILLMARLREHDDVPSPSTVASAVASTGAVITSAGIIFATTFAALLGSPLLGLAEIGFGMAAGLLLDTFVVRTLIVPACATLVGRRNWWPSPRAAHVSDAREPRPTLSSRNKRWRPHRERG
jgi:RND superfamily putative drug exporter